MQRNFLVEDQIQPLESFDGTSPSAAVRPILREVKSAPRVAPRNVHLSIVSHCHGWMIRELLDDLAALPSTDHFRVTLTENIPETTHYNLDDLPFPVSIIKNSEPKGFSANHNAAFNSISISGQDFFVVLNPDVRLQGEPFQNLIKMLGRDPTLGVIGPAVINPKGKLEDSARPVPSLWSLFLKVFGRRGHLKLPVSGGKEYPDWVAGMMMAFRSEVFEAVGGFDEGYHLYYEDVDICCRLWLQGYTVQRDATVEIIHDARRYSREDWEHFRWHLASIARFLRSESCHQSRRFHRTRIR